jgi:hypothetical protein
VIPLLTSVWKIFWIFANFHNQRSKNSIYVHQHEKLPVIK